MGDIDERFILNEEALDELYAWIDTIPLSRPKKNIARDFSDGVLVAETVAHFLPKMVDIHNYFSANAAGQKKINWNTLNRRVFSKMGIRISDSTIQQLIDSKAGAIEQVFWYLRRKIQEPHPVHTTTNSRSVPARSKSPTQSTYSRVSGSSNYQGPSVQRQQQAQPSLPRDLVESPPIDVGPRASATIEQSGPPSRTGSTLTSYSQTPQQQTIGYVVPPSIIGEESSNNNPTSGGPPAQIIYRGHKMIPLGFLEEKDRDIKSLEFANKNFSVKVHRLETLINVKDQRIEDLTHQLHSLRAIYERVTQQTWQGFQQ